ncbi:MAG TPA: NAD-dependent succinate-semialdehyde dehydrogenase [Pyrinomonadaceae bacterium]|jgi:succinate-semialdehyde dehydrogenase/glutarate-semialdehyde dehydrogenase|nr:NAD-dependent succinate-semialdehyde dehydrogenase [Pyrinomonadaceae bacterium]
MGIASVNPATGEKLREFAPLDAAEIENKLQRAAVAQSQHRRTSFAVRAEKMLRAAEILETEKDNFARLMTAEMGKPLQAARDEAAKCALVCRYYAEHAAQFLADEEIETSATRSFVRYEPLGAVLAVMPWNFPFWQVFRFAAPALMAGNVGLLKHASNVPQCALAIEEIFRRAGFVEGVFQTLLLNAEQVGRVIDDARVRAVTLTGSEHAGSDVASRAGKAIKKTVLELGGSDPFIVMPSADFEAAIKTAIKARTINNGQSCIAAKRFIVHTDVYEEFARRFVAGMAALHVGDPSDEATEIGPLATESILEELDEQVRKSVAAGARVLTGGERLRRAGNYYAPTVLAGIPKNSPAYAEEFFGPVALLFRVSSIDEAIELANDTTFGLGASAWTNDAGERTRFIDDIEAGAVFINAMVASDPRMPFGGVKRSGYGRELGEFGIREFVNIKTVWVKDEGNSGDGRRTETE